jgi:uracil-DNA glycosylase
MSTLQTKARQLLARVRACDLCKAQLPEGPRPVLQLDPRAHLLIAGQAPGRKVHATGVPFDDASGERLRAWLGVSREVFYDPTQIAILPMAFCYPGTGKTGDLPPRPECAPAWREALLALLPNVATTLVMGQYAQAYHFGAAGLSVTEQVAAWRDNWPLKLALPHPSPRNNRWLVRNPWFAEEVLPALQARVAKVLAS